MSSREDDPLVQRADALMRRQSPAGESDVPVLTRVVDDAELPRRALDPAALEALAREVERAVLERVAAELERIVGQALERMHKDLETSVTHMVREAIAASVARALALPRRD